VCSNVCVCRLRFTKCFISWLVWISRITEVCSGIPESYRVRARVRVGLVLGCISPVDMICSDVTGSCVC